MNNLKNTVIRGGLVKIFAQITNLALRLGSLVILARLLDPKDFGLVAMVTAIVGFLNLFKDAGLSMATIQRVSVSDEQMSTLFWVNVLVGLFLAAILIASAPAIVAFYDEPRLFWVAFALAADFLFVGITAQHAALLQRQMRFGAISIIDITALSVGIAVAITMALQGWGYWALVGQSIASSFIGTTCTWITTKWTPGLPRRQVGIRSMLRFGGLVTLNNLIVYLAYNLEKILLGRFWGAEALGMYGRAYQLISLPTETLNSSVFGVAFSALSRIQDDPERQKKYFLKGYSLLLAATLPVTIACAIFAEDLIFVLLGEKWKNAAPVFRFLAPTILIFALINPFAWVLYSTGRAGRSLKLACVIAPLVIGAYVIGLPYGPTGVAIAYSTAMSIWVIPHIAWCIHGTGISGRAVFQTISSPLISGIVASIAAIAFQAEFIDVINITVNITQQYRPQFNIPQNLYPLIRLIIGGVVMVVCYSLMLIYVMGQKVFYIELLKELRSRPQPIEKSPV